MGYSFKEQPKEIAYALQINARHEQIERLLKDILTDITICKLEGWNWREYPQMIKSEIDRILKL